MRKRLLSLGLIMVLCFSLTGCKSSDYKKAVELQNSGDYAGALELFKGIGDDYKDVSDRATECQSFIDSIAAFDEAKSSLDDKNAELDKAISEANDLVNGENTALDESLRSSLETKISETKAVKITAPTMAETVKEIDTQTTEMNTTDYSDALKSLNEAYTALNNSVKQYELVNNPAESYVIKCLEKVEHVTGISAVTEDNDPKRFTMIIFNKADDADLPEGGFSEKQVKEILEYRAIEKMYASGIFFVSSIMGLGGKNDGEFVDRFYRKTFRTQSPTFSDPEDIDYMSLYKYNIMPAQVKQNALDYCQKNENLIYANSGLYCIEKEIENFASKHSSYNKCQMVLAFLSNVIDKTNARIDERTKVLKDARDRSTQELDAKTVRLQEEIDRSSKSMEEANGRTSKSDVGEYALSKLNYSFDATQLANMDADCRKQNFEENDFASKAKDYQEAKDKLWEHLKESSQGLFKRNIVDSVKTIANDLSSDFKNVQHSKDKMDAKEKELDQLSSEQILKYVINSYKVNIDDAQEKLSMHLDEYWREKELDFKRALILQITNTDALSDSQREEIADMIQNYDVNNFKEQADSVFVRKRFLKGNLLGIRINDDEKLDIKRLARSYNDRIKRIVNDMSQSMNEDCFSQFKIWEEKLLAKINANLTELNPELKSLAEIIRIETENITELENNQTMIQASLDTIKDLMSWKEAEEG